MSLWLSPEILLWHSRCTGGLSLHAEGKSRHYEHLRRAENLLASPAPSEHDRADCISNLRKCFSQRLKMIEKCYNLRTAVGGQQKTKLFDLLFQIGVIRPFMLKTLLSIRNSIEYDDEMPPCTERCREFCETVWYLLRSTDAFLAFCRSNITLSPDETAPLEDPLFWCEIEVQYQPSFSVGLRGKFPPGIVAHEKGEKFLRLNAEFVSQEHANAFQFPSNETTPGVVGVLELTLEQRKALLHSAFTAIFP